MAGQLQQRIGTIERKLEPGAIITDEQAAEISNKVKAVRYGNSVHSFAFGLSGTDKLCSHTVAHRSPP
ncbi:MAG: hypothetical protein ABJA50_04035 [Chloroflexota bacterium]